MSFGSPFNPSLALAGHVLSALADPDLSFNQVARQFSTNPAALSRWLKREDIQPDLEALDDGLALKARLSASANLHAAVQSAAAIIQEFNSSHPLPDGSEGRGVGSTAAAPAQSPESVHSIPTSPTETNPDADRLRTISAVIRAGNLLLRLARFQGTLPAPRRHAPAPRTADAAHRTLKSAAGHTNTPQRGAADAPIAAPGPHAPTVHATPAAPTAAPADSPLILPNIIDAHRNAPLITRPRNTPSAARLLAAAGLTSGP